MARQGWGTFKAHSGTLNGDWGFPGLGRYHQGLEAEGAFQRQKGLPPSPSTLWLIEDTPGSWP